MATCSFEIVSNRLGLYQLVCHHVKGKRLLCGLYIIVYSLTLFTTFVIVQISVQQCPYALWHQGSFGSLGE